MAALFLAGFAVCFLGVLALAGRNQFSALGSSSKADVALQLGRDGSNELHPHYFAVFFMSDFNWVIYLFAKCLRFLLSHCIRTGTFSMSLKKILLCLLL